MWNRSKNQTRKQKNMHNLWICDLWQDIITSALALSLSFALFTVLLIADTSNLNAGQPHQNPPRPRPWTHPPGGCISHSQSRAEERGQLTEILPGITSHISLSLFYCPSADEQAPCELRLPVGNQSIKEVGLNAAQLYSVYVGVRHLPVPFKPSVWRSRQINDKPTGLLMLPTHLHLLLPSLPIIAGCHLLDYYRCTLHLENGEGVDRIVCLLS